jgi:thiaminase
MRLYAFLGRSLKTSAPAGLDNKYDNKYGEWVEQYGCIEFEQIAKSTEELLDRMVAAEQASGAPNAPSYATLSSLYFYAMNCEVAFFDAHFTARLSPKVHNERTLTQVRDEDTERSVS